jgi:Ca-activated chloride channel homolog
MVLFKKASLMKFSIWFSLVYFLLTISLVNGQTDRALKQGNDLFNKEQYAEAELKYRKSKEKNGSAKSTYNLGNSLYKQEKYEDAISQYNEAVSKSKEQINKSRALYNKGNAEVKSEKMEDAISSYKKALKLNPKDKDAIENLLKAKMLKKQKDQQNKPDENKQKQNKDEKKDEQNNQDKKNEDKNNDDDKPNDKNKGQDKRDGKNDKPNDESGNEKPCGSKGDANQTLEMINREEQKVLDKLKKIQGGSKRPLKDW